MMSAAVDHRRTWLRPREQVVLRLQYENNLLQREIAHVMSISPTRVGQLRAKAISIVQHWADSQEGHSAPQPLHTIVQMFLRAQPDGGLSLALKGICKGHLCDACDVCQSGHCCRRDNPEYRLPETSSWTEPVYGALGEVERSHDGIRCHVCGEIYQTLQSHVWHQHDLTIAEYKALFGLNRSTALFSERLRDISSQSAWKRYLTTNFAERGEEARITFSPERSFYAVKPLRLEGRQHLSLMRGGKGIIRCVICSDFYPTYKAHRRKVCDKPKCFSELQSRLQKERLANRPEWYGKLGAPGETKQKIELICAFCQTPYVTSKKHPRRTCGKDQCVTQMRSEIATQVGLGTKIRRTGPWKKDQGQ